MEYLITVFVVMVLVIIVIRMGVRRITILEYEKGLKYFGGKFKAVIGPGQ